MILPVHQRVRDALAASLSRLYQLPADAVPLPPIEYPPKRELGDLATPVAFELARRLRKAPRAIAKEIAAALGPIEGISRVEATPSGYLNIYLDRTAFVQHIVAGGPRELGPGPQGAGLRTDRDGLRRADVRRAGPFRPAEPRGKAIVEHTAINPNKAAHIGH